jgi:hypothetical protein
MTREICPVVPGGAAFGTTSPSVAAVISSTSTATSGDSIEAFGPPLTEIVVPWVGNAKYPAGYATAKVRGHGTNAGSGVAANVVDDVTWPFVSATHPPRGASRVRVRAPVPLPAPPRAEVCEPVPPLSLRDDHSPPLPERGPRNGDVPPNCPDAPDDKATQKQLHNTHTAIPHPTPERHPIPVMLKL